MHATKSGEESAPRPWARPLQDRVILVTGGSRGIGAATSLAAAEAGAHVALSYRTAADEAERVVHSIRARGRQAVALQADLSDREQARALAGQVLTHFPRIDGLVSNAGIMASQPFLDISTDDWDHVMRTNLSSAFHCCQTVLPGMVQRGQGSIVLLSSRMGQIGWAGAAHYATSKAALLALAKSLAKEFGPQGIRVNAVAPGLTRTDMTSRTTEGEEGRMRRAELPLGRFVEADEVAAAVIFLLSEAAAVFLGQTLNPNAGGYMP